MATDREKGTITVAAVNCAEFNLLLAEVLDRAQLPQPALLHLADCPDCAAILRDFEAIADQIRHLPPADFDAVPNLWPQIQATLRREGIIHTDGRECSSAPTPQLVRTPRH